MANKPFSIRKTGSLQTVIPITKKSLIIPFDMEDISDNLSKYFRKAILKWGKQNFSDFPWRKTTNKWHSLVAEIMLQRTRAEQVLPVYEWFSSKYQKPCDYLKDQNSAVFKSLGLYWRETCLKNLAVILCESDIPTDKNSLLDLPGIGEYAASAYLSLHLGKREPIIDSNVVRLYGRFFGFQTDNETRRSSAIINLAEVLTPKKKFRDYNYGLIDFTRIVCRTKPIHRICPINRKCNYYL